MILFSFVVSSKKFSTFLNTVASLVVILLFSIFALRNGRKYMHTYVHVYDAMWFERYVWQMYSYFKIHRHIWVVSHPIITISQFYAFVVSHYGCSHWLSIGSTKKLSTVNCLRVECTWTYSRFAHVLVSFFFKWKTYSSLYYATFCFRSIRFCWFLFCIFPHSFIHKLGLRCTWKHH